MLQRKKEPIAFELDLNATLDRILYGNRNKAVYTTINVIFSILGIICSIVGIVLMASMGTALMWIPIIALILFVLILFIIFIAECCNNSNSRYLAKKISENFNENIKTIKELSNKTKNFFDKEGQKKG